MSSDFIHFIEFSAFSNLELPFLQSAQVRCQMLFLLQATCRKSSRTIPSREYMVASTGAIKRSTRGDVKNSAVDGEINPRGGIGAVVLCQLLRCQDEVRRLFAARRFICSIQYFDFARSGHENARKAGTCARRVARSPRARFASR